MSKGPSFIVNLEKRDPALFEFMSDMMAEVFTPGALDVKTKLLIAIACDAICGAKAGVENLSKQARLMGISDEEISEAMKVVFLSSCMQNLSSTNAAFTKE